MKTLSYIIALVSVALCLPLFAFEKTTTKTMPKYTSGRPYYPTFIIPYRYCPAPRVEYKQPRPSLTESQLAAMRGCTYNSNYVEPEYVAPLTILNPYVEQNQE